MISAARNIILGNPGVKKVLILDRTPRFDTEEADPTNLKHKLSEYGNKIFRDELEKSDVKDQISIASHSLPTHFQENLYGLPHSNGFDGIHLRGPDGGNHYTRSLCNTLQRFLKEYSREHHNHTIPRTPSTPPTRGAPSTSTAFTLPGQKPSSSLPRKSSSVIINMDPVDNLDDQQYQYAVPTYNPFSILGN